MRPRYGGALHVAVRATPSSLEPLQDGARLPGNLSRLVFETLTKLDEQGRTQPALAASWWAEQGNQRWRFVLRPGVTFEDGSPLTADVVAADLRAANPTWKIVAAGDSVIIERDVPAPDLPAELALPRNSIVKRDAGKLSGTGPFAIAQWDAGRRLVLAARDDYWSGRPFVDSIEIDLGKSFHDQAMLFESGKVQMIEIAPEQAHRAATAGQRIETSAPIELVGLVFDRDPASTEEEKLREALSLSIDRQALSSAVLQTGADPAGGLLPNWLNGYGLLFPATADLARAQQLRGEVQQAPTWNLGWDASDPVMRVTSERVVLNARDAGLRLQLAGGSTPDVRLVRQPILSLDPETALTQLAAALGLTPVHVNRNSLDDLYAAETEILKSRRIIPLLHERTACAVSSAVKNWNRERDGSWDLSDVWLVTEKP
jgi:peptide/nickel transport system substrate-binding protein